MRYPNKTNKVAEPLADRIIEATQRFLEELSDDDLISAADANVKLHGTNCLAYTYDLRHFISDWAGQEMLRRERMRIFATVATEPTK